MACLIALLLWSPGSLSAQGLNDPYVLNAPRFRETFFLKTDRNLYAAGESIHFRAFNLSHPLLKENDWSTVLYLEVVNGRKVAVAQGKFPLDHGSVAGRLVLPDTISSGNFFLRAYTKWMRNFPPSGYSYVPLAIVNPQQLNLETLDYRSGTSREGAEPGMDQPMLQKLKPLHQGLHCSTDASSYAKREKVTIQIGTGAELDPSQGLAVSVAKADYIDSAETCYSGLTVGIPQGPESVRFIPETRGISLDGLVVQGADEHPVPNAAMHLTLLGEEPDYMGLVADKNGRIHFAIPPHQGASNALINFNTNGGSAYKLILEDAFSNEYFQGALPGMDFFTGRMEVLEEMLMYVQLKEAFGITVPIPVSAEDTAEAPYFYGSPEYRYKPADYIQIPNLEEFLFELVPYVVIRKRKETYEVAMMDDAGFYLNNAPLILLDHVAVQDLEALFKTDPRFIEYIDVINTPYIRGGNYYGGILSVLSEAGNLAGVGLPEGSTIIDLQTYQDPDTRLPQDLAPRTLEDHLPDLRTLLFWNPELIIAPGHQTGVQFVTSDIKGSYVVSVTGMSKSGQVIEDHCLFQVE